MGYASYIGRVGALAVTLGVGVALASTPAVAFAEPSDSSSTSSSSSTGESSSSPSNTSADGAEPGDGADGAEPSDPESEASDLGDDATEETDPAEIDVDAEDDAGDDDIGDDGDDAGGDGSSDVGEETEGDIEALSGVESSGPPAGSNHESRASTRDFAKEVESFVNAAVERFAGRENPQSPPESTGAVTDNPVQESAATTTTTVLTSTATKTFTALAAPEAAPAIARPQPTLISLVTETVEAVLRPLMGLGTGAPVHMPALWALFAAARGEFERAWGLRTAPPAAQYSVNQISSPSAQANGTPYVLVIGVDGTNLSRILADPENDNFFELMDQGTTAPASIVGHTTISQPSWSAILTGVWGEKSGVVNNVFTPQPYDRWPTVFNLLETHDPGISTVAIANWNVIADIANAGSIPADQIVFVPHVPGDTNWLLTDDAVGAATVEAIRNVQNGTPTFMFTYFVGVDENGHMYGGASPQYAEAIRNVDDNLGLILDEIAEREKCNPGLCENWTIIVVTDHGHQPQQGFGHGFQSPAETETFVIARGSDFQDGFMNLQYEIVDTTPTVLTLFGATSPDYFDGVSLTTLGAGDVDPVDLHQALLDAIAMNGYPDIGTNIALGVRTIFTSIPYFIYEFTYDIIGQLQAVASQDIFLVSALAGLAVVPVQLVGNLLYVVTNIPAQIVARLTGVTGASIFPLVPPPPSTWPPEQTFVPDLATLACGSATTAGSQCAAPIVA